MGEWKRVKFSDLGRVVTGKTPSTKIEAFWNGNIPFVTPGDLQSTKHIFGTARYVTDDGANAVGSAVLPAGSICVSCIGVIGYVGITTTTSLSNQQINSIVVNQENDGDFVYYLLKGKWDEFKQMEGFSSVVSILNKSTFSDIEACVPPLPTQRRIAAVLGALDDKIEVNRKICENLEAQAQALFKAWFVDFEPFGGKRPEGWKMGKLGDVGEIVGGATPSKAKSEYYSDDGISWITPKDISIQGTKFIAKGEIDITEKGFKSASVKLMSRGSVLFSSRAPIGYVAIARNDICTNQGFKSVVPKNGIGTCFVYEFLKLNKQLIEDRASGSTFKEISTAGMRDIPIMIPDIESLKRFETSAWSLFVMQENKESESRALATMRDALLPKLMSGELAVEKVEVPEMAR